MPDGGTLLDTRLAPAADSNDDLSERFASDAIGIVDMLPTPAVRGSFRRWLHSRETPTRFHDFDTVRRALSRLPEPTRFRPERMSSRDRAVLISELVQRRLTRPGDPAPEPEYVWWVLEYVLAPPTPAADPTETATPWLVESALTKLVERDLRDVEAGEALALVDALSKPNRCGSWQSEVGIRRACAHCGGERLETMHLVTPLASMAGADGSTHDISMVRVCGRCKHVMLFAE